MTMLALETKRCTRCKEESSRDNFHKHPRNKDGLQCYCKPCALALSRANWKPDHKRDLMLRRLYGITSVEYEAMLAKQGGHCATCERTSSARGGLLVVDHCHVTGRVRGLLCDGCNRALGLARNDAALLRRLADYLEGMVG